jgi:DNA ligase (NAD+)
MPKKSIAKMSESELEAAIHHHNQLYFEKNAPAISDYEFDRLVRRLQELKPEAAVLKELHTDVGTSFKGFKKVRREIPMLSLDKCYTEAEIQKWAAKFSGDVMVSPKIDGAAVELRYDVKGRLVLAATRGDGLEGEDITDNVKQIDDIPNQIDHQISQGPLEIRGEIFMKLSVFKSFDQDFANPRNLAAGALKQKDPRKTKEYRLSFFGYDLLGVDVETEAEKQEILKRMKIVTVDMERVDKDHMQAAYDKLLAARDHYDFETDGVVFRAFSTAEQKRLGSTAHHPRHAIAYKFQGDSGTTTLRDVEWSVSRSRIITPIGLVEPVELSGAMVSRVSLHNVGLMQQHSLRQGAQVVMMRRGGVIPYLESVTRPGKGTQIQLPKKCPSCGAATEVRDDFLYCTNPEGCFAAKVGALEYFIKTIEVDGFGRKLIERLYESGLVTDPAEFYELTMERLLEMERMGETLAAKLVKNIQAKRQISLGQFLRSLGIRELAKNAARLLAEEFGSLARIQKATAEEIAAIPSLGEVIGREVVAGLKEKKGLVKKLLKHIDLVESAERPATGPLGGKKVCFTGSLETMGRFAAQKQVEAAGGVAVNTISRDLDFLVMGQKGGGGSKREKAEALQAKGATIQIIGEEDFLIKINDLHSMDKG